MLIGLGTRSDRRAAARPPRARLLLAVPVVLLAAMVTSCGHSSAASPTTRPALAPSSPSTPATAHPTATTAACANTTELASWTLQQRAAQLVVVPVDETSVTEIAPTVRLGIGGIILFGSSASANLKSRLAQTESGAPLGIEPFVMSDEEGGEVQRLANLVGSLPWPAVMTQSMSTGQVHALAQQTAAKMLANGITMDLAPVLDLATGPGPDSLHTDGPRSFSPVALVAESYGLAFAQGLQAGGVIPVVKHFPGEGSASANTDDASATTPPIGTLQSADLLPFVAAIKAGLPVVMVGNASVPGLTTRPAGLSSAVIGGLLRQQLGFQGVVMTDALSAAAITNLGLSTPQASVDALEAGADMVLFTSTSPNTTSSQVIDAIVAAVQSGSLPAQQLDASVARVLALKKVDLCA